MPLSKKIANFLYFWDLKSGMVIISWLVIGVYMMSLGLNSALPNYERNAEIRNAQYGHVFTFLITGMLASFLAFFAAQTKNLPLMIAGLLAVIASSVFYVALYVMSFMPGSWMKLCISNRCPEALWMWSVQWRIPKGCTDAARVFPVVEPAGVYSNFLNKSIIDDTSMLTNFTQLNLNDTKLFSEIFYGSKMKRKKDEDPKQASEEGFEPSVILMIWAMVLGALWIAVTAYYIFIAAAVMAEIVSESEEYDVIEEEEEV